ncbi:prolyl aminopeptidase [Psychrosphaera algicola]|uniref:Proline iminopeptidase n=1 Tax=Psychrosphaera algicola TaxID=3023714 RepID=A0ABT5FDP6_9GAMM|nr:prolyl aminopeptidase [Psychrosphaera sp. G1-22]MDC2889179.1 prolyl aminopeptidase [Psychrosphaera sp. G1-22]
MRSLFPEIKANKTWQIAVNDGHVLYVEESGNPDGIPVVYCHGGPSGGSSAAHRRFYDPQLYRIILFDQRGCGQSTPHCANDINAIWQNTTKDLAHDMEIIRQELNIKRWVVAGGSWGTTVALYYAIEFPEMVLGLLLRGVFLARRQDIEWLFGKGGASEIFPEYYQRFIKGHQFDSTIELLESYYQKLSGENDLEQLTAAKQFLQWESNIVQLKTPQSNPNSDMSNKDIIAMAMLNCHYFLNDCFLYESEIISEIKRIQQIPGYIIHGRYDIVCKAENAFTLDQYWSSGVLEIVPCAGHSCFEVGITDGLVRAGIQIAEFINKK